MIDTLIFDLDGTLLNTLDDLTDSVNYTMQKLSCPVHTTDEVRMMVGNSVNFLIESALPSGSSEALISEGVAVFEQHYHGNMRNKTAPYSGIEQMLAEVKAGGYKMAVVSNKSDGFVKELTAELFGKYIEIAVGRSDKMPRKPAPDTVFYALEQLGSQKENAIYIGDSEVDCKTAKNAGMPCIGCLWGFRDEKTLAENGASAVISHPEQLMKAIAELQA